MAANAKVASIYVQLQAQTAEFKKALQDANVETRKWSATMREESQKSREAVRLLNEDLGVHLPRGLQNIISKMPAVSTAMNLAFNAVVVLTLIRSVVEVTEKVSEFIKKNEEAAKKNTEAWRALSEPIDSTNDKMRVTNDKLEEQIAKLEHKPVNELKTALDESTEHANHLYDALVKANRQSTELLEKNQTPWYGAFFGQEQTKDITNQVTDQDTKVDSAMSARSGHQQYYQEKMDAAGPASAANKAARDAIATQAAEQYKKDTAAVIAALSTAAKLMTETYGTTKKWQDDPSGRHGADWTNILSISGGEAHKYQSMLIGERLDQQNLSDTSTLGKDKIGKTNNDAAKKAFGIQVDELIKGNEDVAKEQKRITTEVNEYGERLVREYLDDKVRANKEEEASDRQKAEAFKQNVQAQIQAQRDLIEAASEKYKHVDKDSTERVRWGQETEGGRAQEMSTAAQDESNAKAAAYHAITELLFSVGKGTGSEAVKAGDDGIKAEQEGQQKIYDVHAQYAEEIRQKWLNALSGVNQELANMMTGQKTNWSGMFRGEANRLAQSGLRKAENAGLNALGIGGKADGSKANPWYVKSADSQAGGLSGQAGGGLLGMLNDSDWASSLFGGKLFGSGSFFGGHALGGPALGGVPIPVGELGPETFVPSTPGTIIPHNAGGSSAPSIGYIDARGTDPALTRENVARAIAMSHAQAAHSAQSQLADRQRRTAH
jgi:hypothetical protein